MQWDKVVKRVNCEWDIFHDDAPTLLEVRFRMNITRFLEVKHRQNEHF